jgi:hypothetical protein
MHVEVQVNGTPFHYGAVLVSYEPSIGTRNSVDGDWRQHSNLQHGFISPTNSQSVKLTCPFIHPKNWIDLNDSSGTNVGVVNLDTVVPLASASAATDPVTIIVYAWMTDVELAFPTNQVPAVFTPQAKKVKKMKRGPTVGKDEYEVVPNSGLISAPATAIANIASKLTAIPIIGPFMTATQIGASSIADIATLFGYSRPTSLEAPVPFLNAVVSRMAVTDQVSNAVPLTVCSKAETTIDPRVIGLDTGEDELTVGSIVRKPTLMNVSDIGVSASVGTTVLSIPVQPHALQTTSGVYPQQITFLSALGFGSVPFKYWTGTIVFRFQIICSAYHRGRLRFQYSPYEGVTIWSSGLNDTYNHIVDISPGKEIEIVVPYASARPMLALGQPDNGGGAPNAKNGELRVVIQNEVSAPESVTPIKLLTWVYAGEDYKVAVPTSSWYATAALTPQSAHEVDDGVTVYESVSFCEAPISSKFDLTIIGDPVESFRPLMKRMQYHTSTRQDVVSTPSGFVGQRTIRIPFGPQRSGPVTYGSATTLVAPFTITNPTFNHIINWLEPSFLAKRGGMRWRADCSVFTLENLPESRKGPLLTVGNFDSDNVAFGDTMTQMAQNFPNTYISYLGDQYLPSDKNNAAGFDTGSGMQVFSQNLSDQQPEFQIAPYFPYKFYTNFGTDTSTYYPRRNTSVYMTRYNFSLSTSILLGPVPIFVSAAEDFTMNVFLGVPRWLNLGQVAVTPDLRSGGRVQPLP